MPENGRYLVLTTIAENPDCLMLMFPEQSNGTFGFKVFNTETRKSIDLLGGLEKPVDGTNITIDNFRNFANMEETTTRFNEFVFSSGEDSANEVQNIGSFDVSNDEPVEINNTNTDTEETEMKFKPINEEIDDTNETKWVEIPASNAHRVTVAVEDAAAEDPFAGEAPTDDAAADAPAPDANADAATADAPATDAPAEEPAPDASGAEAPADDATAPETIDDPKAKMRDLLAYYTNYMTDLVKDPNTSTELISATQEMIDSLIQNMESADSIEEVKAEAEGAAAEEAPTEEAPAEEAPAEAPAEETPAEETPVTEEVEEDKKIDELADADAKIDAEIDELHKDDVEDIAPATSDNVLTPSEQSMAMVDDVDLSGIAPTEDEELAATSPDMDAPAPTSDVDVLTDTDALTPDEEVSLMGDDDYGLVGADGLPVDKFEGDYDAMSTPPIARPIQWSPDYLTNGVATTDDNTNIVPSVLSELSGYYSKVADEVSKVPGKEDIAMKLQKIQILSQTIASEWNSIVANLGGCVANSYDRSNMGTLEKDELDSMDAMNQIGAGIMADQEAEEEDELAIDDQIDKFVESFKHLI